MSRSSSAFSPTGVPTAVVMFGGRSAALGGPPSVSHPVSVYLDSKLLTTITKQSMRDDITNRAKGR
jgi:hypothetical protein